MPFQYANEANPRAHYEGTGAEIARGARPRRRPRRRPRHRRDADGRRARGCARASPTSSSRRPSRCPGDPVMGLRSLEDGYVPPILDVVEARPEAARLERGGGRRRCTRCSTARGSSPASPRGAVVHVARRLAERARRRASWSACSPTAAGSTSPPASGREDVEEIDGEHALVVVPPPVREELAEHARRRLPNESCGLLVFRDGVAERYEPRPQRGRLAVPLRARDRPRALVPRGRGLRARGLPLALSAPPRPSRTDVENVGLWAGQAVPDLLGRARRARGVDDRATARSSRSSSPNQRPRRRSLLGREA